MPVQNSIHTIICGPLHQETIIDSLNHVHLKQPGGGLLYAASGHALFDKNIGLVAKTHSEFLSTFQKDFKKLNADLQGITIISSPINDIRYYRIKNRNAWETTNYIRHFYELGFEIPKHLLHSASCTESSMRKIRAENPPLTSSDFPALYEGARNLLLTPMDYLSHFSCIPALRNRGIQQILIRSSSSYMVPGKLVQLPKLLNGIDYFFTTENEIRTLFAIRFDRYHAMLKALQTFGAAHIIIKNNNSGYLLLNSTQQQAYQIPDYSVYTVDPTGEYDCFCGAFAACLSQSSLEEAAAKASAAASVCREGSGIDYILDTYPDIVCRRAEMILEDITSSSIASITA
jgi:hypothetical protein